MTIEADKPKPASHSPDRARTHLDWKVLMVRRSAGMAFGASAWVFAGGKVAQADADPAWDDLSDGTYDHYARSLRIASGTRSVRGEIRTTACHTRWRGTGRRRFQSPLTSSAPRVEADPTVFIQLITRRRYCVLALDRLVPFAHWITPSFEPRRFDAHFFLVRAPAGQVVRHDGQDAVDHEWVSPASLLQRRLTGEAELDVPDAVSTCRCYVDPLEDGCRSRGSRRTAPGPSSRSACARRRARRRQGAGHPGRSRLRPRRSAHEGS